MLPVVAESFVLEGGADFLEGPNASLRSLARSRYSGVFSANAEALANFAEALTTRSSFLRLSR